MPLRSYGVLTARPIEHRRETSGDTPHHQVLLHADDGTAYRSPINVKSSETPSELLYLVYEDFHHPVTAAVEALGPGWHALERKPGGPNLDYVRANLLDAADMRVLPPNVEGPDNDLQDLLERWLDRAIADPTAQLHIFGEPWGPEPEADQVFGFSPGHGVHDVHMNQGNSLEFEHQDGVWQDGGLLFHFPSAGRWVAIFLAFQSQKWHTDDTTGHALDREVAPSVAIVAAMVNPVGPAPEQEWVLLLGASPDPVDLTGWQLADRAKNTFPVPGGALEPGATLKVEIAPPMQLGNHGGAITLLDDEGLKVAGVAYTERQAQREGWAVVF